MFKDRVQQLATEWNLTIQQLAAVTGLEEAFIHSKLDSQNDGASIPAGLEPIATLMGLQDRLRKTFPEIEKQLEWLSTGNPHFDGFKPMDLIRMGPERTRWISYYLETRLTFQNTSTEDDDEESE